MVEGKRVLCFSTDPQASLSDVFERDLYGKGITEVTENLYAVEIDADTKIENYQREIKEKIINMYGLEALPEEIEEYIEAAAAEPAMYESATYDAMAELVSEGGYDVYVFDMPAFGHGVRMVAMAEILSKWVEKITEAREKAGEYEAVAATLRGGVKAEDKVLDELIEIREKIKTFTDLVVDKKRTAFFVVLTPEVLPILVTERALNVFRQLGITMAGIILNEIYPVKLLEEPGLSDFLRTKVMMQQRCLSEIRNKFGAHIVSSLPMYDREPRGLEMLKRFSEDLMFPKIVW